MFAYANMTMKGDGHDNEWNGHGEKMRLRHDESPSIVILDRVECPTSSSTE